MTPSSVAKNAYSLIVLEARSPKSVSLGYDWGFFLEALGRIRFPASQLLHIPWLMAPSSTCKASKGRSFSHHGTLTSFHCHTSFSDLSSLSFFHFYGTLCFTLHPSRQSRITALFGGQLISNLNSIHNLNSPLLCRLTDSQAAGNRT